MSLLLGHCGVGFAIKGAPLAEYKFSGKQKSWHVSFKGPNDMLGIS
jgi:hypothetical protein